MGPTHYAICMDEVLPNLSLSIVCTPTNNGVTNTAESGTGVASGCWRDRPGPYTTLNADDVYVDALSVSISCNYQMPSRTSRSVTTVERGFSGSVSGVSALMPVDCNAVPTSEGGDTGACSFGATLRSGDLIGVVHELSWSNSASSSLVIEDVNVPSRLRAVGSEAGNGQAKILWDRPLSGKTPLQYDLRYYGGTVDTWTTLNPGPGTNRTATLSGLVNWTTYYVQVRARNSERHRPLVRVSARDVRTPPPLDAPKGLLAWGVTGGKMAVMWTCTKRPQ